jgi:hypothetical protein
LDDRTRPLTGWGGGFEAEALKAGAASVLECEICVIDQHPPDTQAVLSNKRRLYVLRGPSTVDGRPLLFGDLGMERGLKLYLSSADELPRDSTRLSRSGHRV